MERVFRREIVWRLFFVFVRVRGKAVRVVMVSCGWRIWPASHLTLRSKSAHVEKTGLSDGTIKREIAFLKKSGYLERIGSLKYFLFRLQKIYA